MPTKKARDAANGKGQPRKPNSSPRDEKPREELPPVSEAPRDERGQFSGPNANSFRPGQSGNPLGRPKCKTLSEAIREQLALEVGDGTGITWAELVAERLVKVAAGMSIENSTNAAKEIADRTEGKARQPLELDATGEATRILAGLLGRRPEDLQIQQPSKGH